MAKKEKKQKKGKKAKREKAPEIPYAGSDWVKSFLATILAILCAITVAVALYTIRYSRTSAPRRANTSRTAAVITSGDPHGADIPLGGGAALLIGT